MSETMAIGDLVRDLRGSIHDAASLFSADGDADWLRLLRTAAQAMQAKRPRTLLGMLSLRAGESVYPLDAESFPDFAQYKTHLWGHHSLRPWDPGYPGALPRVVGEGASLCFTPAPSSAHIAACGSTFRFWYFAQHRLGDDAEDSTLPLADRRLLLLRAQAEAMRELCMHNVNKPVGMRDGFSGMPRNSTPAALYEALLKEWESEQ